MNARAALILLAAAGAPPLIAIWAAPDLAAPLASEQSAAERPIETASSEARVAPTASSTPSNLVEDILARLREEGSKHRDAVAREAFLQKAVRGVPRALYRRLAEVLKDAPRNSLDAELLRAVLLRWAWEEPMNAADWAVEQTSHPYRKEALAFAAQSWARRDPAQLLTWTADLPAADQEWVLLRSGDFLGRTGPALFSVWQQAIPPGRQREQLLLALSHEWAQRDPNTLAAALAENTGPEFAEWRRLTIAALTTRLENMDGPDAARFAMEQIPPGPDQSQALLGAVAAWARQDPDAASQWIERLPQEELRVQASQVLLGHWLQRDPSHAQTYAQSLAAGPVADDASEQVARFLSAKNDGAALMWAERIDDRARRERTLAFVLAETSRRDPEGFRLLLLQRPELSFAAPRPEG